MEKENFGQQSLTIPPWWMARRARNPRLQWLAVCDINESRALLTWPYRDGNALLGFAKRSRLSLIWMMNADSEALRPEVAVLL